jgi:hypothetical protein
LKFHPESNGAKRFALAPSYQNHFSKTHSTVDTWKLAVIFCPPCGVYAAARAASDSYSQIFPKTHQSCWKFHPESNAAHRLAPPPSCQKLFSRESTAFGLWLLCLLLTASPVGFH